MESSAFVEIITQKNFFKKNKILELGNQKFFMKLKFPSYAIKLLNKDKISELRNSEILF